MFNKKSILAAYVLGISLTLGACGQEAASPEMQPTASAVETEAVTESTLLHFTVHLSFEICVHSSYYSRKYSIAFTLYLLLLFA